MDEQSQLSTPILINFNPLNTPINLKGTFRTSLTGLLQQIGGKVKVIELNDLSDFSSEIVHARVLGLTGSASPALVPVIPHYGRELI